MNRPMAKPTPDLLRNVPLFSGLDDSELEGIGKRLSASPGDVLLLAADHWRTVVEVLGGLRLDLGRPAPGRAAGPGHARHAA